MSHRSSTYRTGSVARSLAVGCGVLLAVLAPATASAYRTNAELEALDTDIPAVWPWARFNYELNTELPEELDETAALATLDEAFSVWSEPECTGWTSELTGTTSRTAEYGDGRNTVQFVFKNWAGTGAEEDVGAITDIDYQQASDGTWYIAEADLYLNAEALPVAPAARGFAVGRA